MGHDGFNPNCDGLYTIPQSGFYTIKGTFQRMVPTGRTITVVNEDRRWFQFWKPKMVERAEYERVYETGAEEVRCLKAGDTVHMALSPRRIKY